MDAAYLRENVGEVLAAGLTQTLVRQPEDSVEYLANWLLDYVDNLEKEQKKKEYVEDIIKRDTIAQKKEAKIAQIKEQEKIAAVTEATNRGENLVKFLKSATDMDGLLQRFAELLKEATNATSVYFSKLCNDPYDVIGGEVSGTERDPSNDYLKFIVTTDTDKELLNHRIDAGEGITLELFEQDEPLPDEYEEYYDEETGEYVQKLLPKPELPPKTVFVPNILSGVYSDKIKLINLPNNGCYLGLRIQYDSCLHDFIFDEAELREKELDEQELEEAERLAAEEEERKMYEEEEEEERRRIREEEDEYLTDAEKAERDAREEAERLEKFAKEAEALMETEEEKEARLSKEAAKKAEERQLKLIESLTKQKVGFVLGLDTIGQNRRFNDNEVQTILKLGKLFEQTLIRIDRETFKQEYATRKTLLDGMSKIEQINEEDRMQILAQQYDQAKKLAAGTDEKNVTREDVNFTHRQQLLIELRHYIIEMRSFSVCRGPITIMQALFYLLKYPHEKIANNDNHSEWSVIRNYIDDQLIAKIEEFDVRSAYAETIVDKDPTVKRVKAVKPEENTPAYYTSIDGIEQLLSNIDIEDLQQRNYIFYEIYGFIIDAIMLWRRADKEHRRYMATERARIKREKEEAEELERQRLEEEEAAREAAAMEQEEDEDYEN